MIDQTDKLLVLRDKDIFPDAADANGIVWKNRVTGKVVLFDEVCNIALIGNKVNDLFLLPGGGIEDNEALLDGVRRECKEETGCEINIKSVLGVTEDFRIRDNKHCISHGYTAGVISHGTPSFTEDEIEIGAYVKWIPLSEAVKLFELQEVRVKAGEVKFYNTCFNVIRDSLFIRQAWDIEQGIIKSQSL